MVGDVIWVMHTSRMQCVRSSVRLSNIDCWSDWKNAKEKARTPPAHPSVNNWGTESLSCALLGSSQ